MSNAAMVAKHDVGCTVTRGAGERLRVARNPEPTKKLTRQRNLKAQPHARQLNDITRREVMRADEGIAVDVGGRDALALPDLPARRAGVQKFNHLLAFFAERYRWLIQWISFAGSNAGQHGNASRY